MGFLETLMDEVSVGEAPSSFFYWSGLAALSAVAGRRFFVKKRGLFKIYPNIFVFLISQKSGLGKGFPVSVAENVVVKLGNSRVILGQASIEGVVKELASVHTCKTTGRVINTAEAFLVSGEFGAFLQDNPKLFTQLTDLYDSQYHATWVKTLATQNKAELTDVCISGLFAANEVHFNEALPVHAKKGGFLGRVITVYESKRRHLNPAIRPSNNGKSDEVDYDKLVKLLQPVTQINGEMFIEDKAIHLYETWYMDFYTKEHTDDTGTSERMRDNILKVGMLLSLSDRTDLIITEEHMQQAIFKCTEGLASTRVMSVGEGKQENAQKAKAILRALANAKGFKLSRRHLLINGYGEFDALDLDRIMETFIQAGMIRKIRDDYELTETAIEMLTKSQEGEAKN